MAPTENTHLALAVSGGADSMALALMMHDWASQQPQPPRITALHVDHGLRPESGAQALQVQRWLTQRGIACEILTLSANDTAYIRDGNTMARARAMRYRVLCDWCHAHGADALYTGHHADDQMETFLMRLGRGSGIDGLSAMLPVSERDGIKLYRPLLPNRRNELELYLRELGQPWLNDPTNQDRTYTRNRLRQLLPALEAEGITPERILAVTEHLSRAADCLNTLADQWITSHMHPASQGVTLPYTAYAALHHELALRVMRLLLPRVSRNNKEVRYEHLAPLVQALQVTPLPDWKARTLHHCRLSARKRDGALLISPQRPQGGN